MRLSENNKRYGGYWRYENLIDFCYLVNPYFPTKKIEDEIKFSLEIMRSYPSGESVHAMLASKLFDVPTDQIVVGNGAAELIDILSKRIKGKLAVFGPTFEEYPERFKKLETKTLSSKIFQYSSTDLIGLSEGREGIVVVNPDNPSGNYIVRKDLIKVIKKLNEDGKYIILDESFIDFADDGFEASFLNRHDLKNFPNLIVIKSIGKSYGVGGLRIGVLASSNQRLVQSIKRFAGMEYKLCR